MSAALVFLKCVAKVQLFFNSAILVLLFSEKTFSGTLLEHGRQKGIQSTSHNDMGHKFRKIVGHFRPILTDADAGRFTAHNP